MGLRDRIALALVTVVFVQLTIIYCMPSTSRKSVKTYFDDLRQAKSYSAAKTSVLEKGNKAKNPVIPNSKNVKTYKDFQSKQSMYKAFNFPEIEYPHDTSSRDPFGKITKSNINPFAKLTNGMVTPQSKIISDLKKEKRMNRKLNRINENENNHVKREMPSITSSIPESMWFKEQESFPDVQYPTNAMETWAPHFWNQAMFTGNQNVDSSTFDPEAAEKSTIFFKPYKQQLKSKPKQFMEHIDELMKKMQKTKPEVKITDTNNSDNINGNHHDRNLEDILFPDLNTNNITLSETDSALNKSKQAIFTDVNRNEWVNMTSSKTSEAEDIDTQSEITAVKSIMGKEPVLSQVECDIISVTPLPILHNVLEYNNTYTAYNYTENEEISKYIGTVQPTGSAEIQHIDMTKVSSLLDTKSCVENVSDPLSHESLTNSDSPSSNNHTNATETKTKTKTLFSEKTSKTRNEEVIDERHKIKSDVEKIPNRSVFVMPMDNSAREIQLPITDNNSPIILIIPTSEKNEKYAMHLTNTPASNSVSVIEVNNSVPDTSFHEHNIVYEQNQDLYSKAEPAQVEYNIIEIPSKGLNNLSLNFDGNNSMSEFPTENTSEMKNKTYQNNSILIEQVIAKSMIPIQYLETEAITNNHGTTLSSYKSACTSNFTDNSLHTNASTLNVYNTSKDEIDDYTLTQSQEYDVYADNIITQSNREVLPNSLSTSPKHLSLRQQPFTNILPSDDSVIVPKLDVFKDSTTTNNNLHNFDVVYSGYQPVDTVLIKIDNDNTLFPHDKHSDTLTIDIGKQEKSVVTTTLESLPTDTYNVMQGEQFRQLIKSKQALPEVIAVQDMPTLTVSNDGSIIDTSKVQPGFTNIPSYREPAGTFLMFVMNEESPILNKDDQASGDPSSYNMEDDFDDLITDYTDREGSNIPSNENIDNNKLTALLDKTILVTDPKVIKTDISLIESVNECELIGEDIARKIVEPRDTLQYNFSVSSSVVSEKRQDTPITDINTNGLPLKEQKIIPDDLYHKVVEDVVQMLVDKIHSDGLLTDIAKINKTLLVDPKLKDSLPINFITKDGTGRYDFTDDKNSTTDNLLTIMDEKNHTLTKVENSMLNTSFIDILNQQLLEKSTLFQPLLKDNGEVENEIKATNIIKKTAPFVLGVKTPENLLGEDSTAVVNMEPMHKQTGTNSSSTYYFNDFNSYESLPDHTLTKFENVVEQLESLTNDKNNEGVDTELPRTSFIISDDYETVPVNISLLETFMHDNLQDYVGPVLTKGNESLLMNTVYELSGSSLSDNYNNSKVYTTDILPTDLIKDFRKLVVDLVRLKTLLMNNINQTEFYTAVPTYNMNNKVIPIHIGEKNTLKKKNANILPEHVQVPESSVTVNTHSELDTPFIASDKNYVPISTHLPRISSVDKEDVRLDEEHKVTIPTDIIKNNPTQSMLNELSDTSQASNIIDSRRDIELSDTAFTNKVEDNITLRTDLLQTAPAEDFETDQVLSHSTMPNPHNNSEISPIDMELQNMSHNDDDFMKNGSFLPVLCNEDGTITLKDKDIPQIYLTNIVNVNTSDVLSHNSHTEVSRILKDIKAIPISKETLIKDFWTVVAGLVRLKTLLGDNINQTVLYSAVPTYNTDNKVIPILIGEENILKKKNANILPEHVQVPESSVTVNTGHSELDNLSIVPDKNYVPIGTHLPNISLVDKDVRLDKEHKVTVPTDFIMNNPTLPILNELLETSQVSNIIDMRRDIELSDTAFNNRVENNLTLHTDFPQTLPAEDFGPVQIIPDPTILNALDDSEILPIDMELQKMSHYDDVMKNGSSFPVLNNLNGTITLKGKELPEIYPTDTENVNTGEMLSDYPRPAVSGVIKDNTAIPISLEPLTHLLPTDTKNIDLDNLVHDVLHDGTGITPDSVVTDDSKGYDPGELVPDIIIKDTTPITEIISSSLSDHTAKFMSNTDILGEQTEMVDPLNKEPINTPLLDNADDFKLETVFIPSNYATVDDKTVPEQIETPNTSLTDNRVPNVILSFNPLPVDEEPMATNEINTKHFKLDNLTQESVSSENNVRFKSLDTPDASDSTSTETDLTSAELSSLIKYLYATL